MTPSRFAAPSPRSAETAPVAPEPRPLGPAAAAAAAGGAVRGRALWTPGNRLQLLENGEQYYPAVFDAIRAARREVLLETFIWFDDKVGRELREVLIDAGRRGVEVHVLVDGWGSPDLDDDFTAPLVEAGVRLRAYEPVQRLFGARVNLLRRMHRKIVVVDGEVAFVGGINYSIDHLAEYGPKAKQDYAVRVDGPLVEQIHAFCRASLEHPQPPRDRWWRRWRWPAAWRRGRDAAGEGALAAFVTRDNNGHRQDIEHQYRLALRGARQRIVIANAYFFPGWRLLRDLRRAARRGVRVDLILQGEPDMAIVQTAASLLYGHLLRAGVRVHEYCERPLHGKVAVVDDRWATVGSSNLDPTSLGLNMEANVFVRDDAFARHLRERLDDLIEHRCKAIEVERPGALLSGWVSLRSAIVFHFLRRFPDWALRWRSSRPRVADLRPGTP